MVQFGGTWYTLVQLSAHLCNMVQFGATGASWCRLVQHGAPWFNLVRAIWFNLVHVVQISATWCPLVQFGGL